MSRKIIIFLVSLSCCLQMHHARASLRSAAYGLGVVALGGLVYKYMTSFSVASQDVQGCFYCSQTSTSHQRGILKKGPQCSACKKIVRWKPDKDIAQVQTYRSTNRPVMVSFKKVVCGLDEYFAQNIAKLPKPRQEQFWNYKRMLDTINKEKRANIRVPKWDRHLVAALNEIGFYKAVDVFRLVAETLEKNGQLHTPQAEAFMQKWYMYHLLFEEYKALQSA